MLEAFSLQREAHILEKLQKLRREILSSPLWLALLFIPFFPPQALIRINVTNQIYGVLRKVAALCVGGMFLLRPRISKITALLGAYQAVILLSITINHGRYATWANEAMCIGVLCVLVDMAAEKDGKALIKGLFYSLGLVCTVNLATVFLCPNGLYKEEFYFLGVDNAHPFYILPLLGIAMVYAWYVKHTLAFELFLLVFFTASIYYTWSVTGVIAATAFIALYLLYRVRENGKVFNICVYFGVIAVMFVLVILLRVQEHLAFFFENILNKSVTFSGRSEVWDSALDYIADKPLLGYGVIAGNGMYGYLNQLPHCHNIFLQVLFEAGVIGLVVYLAVLASLIRPLLKWRDHFVGYMLAAAVFAILLDFVAEATRYPRPYIILFVLAYHTEELIKAGDAGRPETLPGA